MCVGRADAANRMTGNIEAMLAAEQHQYDNVCGGQFRALADGQDTILAEVQSVKKGLFEGKDGQPSLTTIVYGHGLALKLIFWVGGSITVAVIGALVAGYVSLLSQIQKMVHT